MYKKYEHNPPHLFRENCKYFITGATYQHKRCFKTDEAKEHLLYSIKKGFADNGWMLEDWVILDNHYHLMVQSGKEDALLTEIIRDIHKFTAIWLNKYENTQNRKVWHNYWDSCITYESSYFARLNYIWYNPVKHGYCQYAQDYIFGSYHSRYQKDKGYLEALKCQYPWDEMDLEFWSTLTVLM
jgi:REP-associated tyrosine transposase